MPQPWGRKPADSSRSKTVNLIRRSAGRVVLWRTRDWARVEPAMPAPICVNECSVSDALSFHPALLTEVEGDIQ